MDIFVGRFTMLMDSKSRVAIPVAFRNSFPGGRVTILHGVDGCLCLLPTGAVSGLFAATRTESFVSESEARRFQRRMLDGASIESMDAKGRIRLSAEQTAHAAISREVSMLGMLDRIEIWNPDRLDEFMVEPDEGSLESMAQNFFNHGLGGENEEFPLG